MRAPPRYACGRAHHCSLATKRRIIDRFNRRTFYKVIACKTAVAVRTVRQKDTPIWVSPIPTSFEKLDKTFNSQHSLIARPINQTTDSFGSGKADTITPTAKRRTITQSTPENTRSRKRRPTKTVIGTQKTEILRIAQFSS